MNSGKLILGKERLRLTIERLCCQVIEDWADPDEWRIVGIQPRGVPLADRIHRRLCELCDGRPIPYGKLDITFYRDDFRMYDKPLTVHPNEMEFLVADKKVLFVDDVLYTGRTIQAALAALQHYGRPKAVELLVLVDRRFNRHLPIQPDFAGIAVDALDDAYVKVKWEEIHGEDSVILYDAKHNEA